MNAKALFTALLAAIAFTAPASADRKTTVYRDRDGDGHYNKKTYDSGRHYSGRGYSGRGYSNRGYYNRGYYNRGYYGRSYYGYPYYGYGYGYYPRTSFFFNFSRPAYYGYDDSRVYRGAVVGDSLAVDVQRALRSRGYYRGYIDGDVGPGTRAAIRAYQRDRGLSVTGRIDSSLLRSLRIS